MQTSMVAADITKWVAYGPIRVNQVFGYNNQASDLYLQFHQIITPITTTSVPAVKSLWCPAQAGFSWAFPGGLSLSELVLAPSTTETLYTAVAASGGLDLTLVYDTDYDATAFTAANLVGDLTTNVANRQIWAESSGPKKLLRLDVKNNAGASRYGVIQASDASSTTDTNFPPFLITNGATKTLHFGKAGLVPYRNDAGTARVGCTIRGSTVATNPLSLDASTNYNIRAVIA